jgi:hypothetical protein
LLAALPQPDRIADGLAGSGHVIKPPLCADNDGARSDRLFMAYIAARTCAASTVAKPAAPTAAAKNANRVHSLTLNRYTKMFRVVIAVRSRAKSRTDPQ